MAEEAGQAIEVGGADQEQGVGEVEVVRPDEEVHVGPTLSWAGEPRRGQGGRTRLPELFSRSAAPRCCYIGGHDHDRRLNRPIDRQSNAVNTLCRQRVARCLPRRGNSSWTDCPGFSSHGPYSFARFSDSLERWVDRNPLVATAKSSCPTVGSLSMKRLTGSTVKRRQTHVQPYPLT